MKVIAVATIGVHVVAVTNAAVVTIPYPSSGRYSISIVYEGSRVDCIVVCGIVCTHA
jgi:hypothetical protein